MSSSLIKKLSWPLISLGVLAGSLSCIINDGRAKGECDSSTLMTCDGDKIVYCDSTSFQGRQTPGELVSVTCDLGCETFSGGAQCKNECILNTDTCLDDKTIERCAYYSPTESSSKADYVEPSSPNSYYRKELERCDEGERCVSRSNGFSSFVECTFDTTPRQDMGGGADLGPTQDMSQPPRDMGPAPDMSPPPRDMGGGAADLGPTQDMASPPDMSPDMSDMSGPVQPGM